MPKVEVDEAEWLASKQVTQLFADTLNNPEARKRLLEAKKIVRPNEPVPELDAAKPIQDELSKLREEMAADRRERTEAAAEAKRSADLKKFEDQWTSQKSALREQGWLDDGIVNIEKLAQERGIADLEAAALLYERLHPKPVPVEPSGYGRWNSFEPPQEGAAEDSFMKAMMETRGENEAALDSEIRAAINDVRGATPARR